MFGSSQHNATADHLNNIIQVLELGRKSGVLTVERADSVQPETGKIVFIHGQITEIHVGRLLKHQALIWLKTWERCHFNFEPSAGESNTGPQAPLELTRTTAPLRNEHVKTPIPTFVATDYTKTSVPAFVTTNHTKTPVPVFAAAEHVKPAFAATDRTKTPIPAFVAAIEYAQSQEGRRPFDMASVPPVPYRTRSIPESSQLLAHSGASRLHQRLFLLIDGRRTLSDFMYLLKHSQEEVSSLLHDLELIGVIKQ